MIHFARPAPPMHYARPVLAKQPHRKDYLVEALVQRERRLRTQDIPADHHLGPLHADWIERLEGHAFGDGTETIDDLTDDEDRDAPPPLKRTRTAAQMKSRANSRRNFEANGTVSSQKVGRISKEVERKVVNAKVNYTVFKDFDFDRAVRKLPNPIPPNLTIWDDNTPRSAQSKDGINMAFYIPNFLTSDWTYTISENLINFGQYRSTPHFKMKVGEHATYVKRRGELAGGLACVRGWNAIGGKRQKNKFKVAKEMVQTAEAHSNATDLLLNLGIVSHHANSFLLHADRTHYQDAVNLRNIACNQLASQAALGTIDPLIYEGRELLFNRVSEEHTDSQDPPFGWAILVALGHNSPVTLTLTQLNVQMRFRPGDGIAIRGRVLKHKTSAWETGQRIVIPHFTHSATWQTFNQTGALERCDTS